LLTRTTAILALVFFATSLSLVWFSNRDRAPRSIIEQGAPAAPVVPVAPSAPAVPAAPSVPAAPAAPPPQPTPAEPAQPSPPLSR